MKSKKILVTGAAGYIGSIFTYEALNKGYHIIGIDNFSNSDDAIIKYFLKNYPHQFKFYESDICDMKQISKPFCDHRDIGFIMHFAALKSVSESEKNFELYWKNNVEGTNNILQSMKVANIKNIIFSSSASIYGEQEKQPINENLKPNPISNYALTKLESEKCIKKFASNDNINAISLRYFNPLATHIDNIIFEDFRGSNNLISKILQAATKRIEYLEIYGNDYCTNDGTAERDFIHMQDLIDGHFSALNKIEKLGNYNVINLGTGTMVSVLEITNIFKKVNNLDFQVVFSSKRDGDISINYACVNKAKKVLGWQSSYNLEKMCLDAWIAIQNELK